MVFSLHSNDSYLTHDDVGGFFFDFEAVRTVSSEYDAPHRQQGKPMGIALDNGLGPAPRTFTLENGEPIQECWGHGYCGGPEKNMTCQCDAGWYGNCNVSSCPKGPAWFDQADGPRSAHRLAECSNAGSCDHATGT